MTNNCNRVNRRKILQLAGLGLGTAVLSNCSSSSKKEEGVAVANAHQTFRRGPTSDDDNPIDRTFGEIAPLKFTGDEPDHSHQILWDVQGFLANIGGKVPDPTEKAPVVVIGGGMSGLFSAYRLKKFLPIVLERADRFGGVSRGESWRGIDYSIGAAYLGAPEEGSPLDQLFKELDLNRLVKMAPEDEPVSYKGKVFNHFFKGDTDPNVASQGAILEKYFVDVLESKNGRVYPEMPPENDAQLAAVKELDKLNFRDHIKKVLGSDTVHPHLDTWFEHYSWSTFGASYREISAAIGVNQMAAEFGKVAVLPGGNSAIAEALLRKLKKTVGSERIRARAVVFQVKVVDDGVWVSYERDGQVKTILAESVIFACPKYVISRVLQGLEPERARVIRRLRYNSYLVANVLLNQKVPSNFYDLYLLGDGKINGRDIQGSSDEDRCTDVVNATYAKEDGKSGILTLYRPFPYLNGRAQIYSGGAYLKYRKELIDQIENDILPSLGIPATAVAGIRMTRWGHPMPVAQPGLIQNGSADLLQKPIVDKIYFVNQDNWLNPCIETAFGEAQKWAPLLEKALEERRLAKQKQATKTDSGATPDASDEAPKPAAPESPKK